MKDGCPLCIEKPTTYWYDNSHKDYRILDCPACGRPIACYKEHHPLHDKSVERGIDMGRRLRLREYTAQYFGDGYELREDIDHAPGHGHFHVEAVWCGSLRSWWG